ncbi:single-stranded DNA-binding protein [Candidatus Saccharibacteria bacterium]|nr:single-stranded DNA-binding protein [Candidatus Saccharibacteria bacterium]NCU43369.1 single-stranded DNA-binding protein [Candidatus Saccharibacteria bacterium]
MAFNKVILLGNLTADPELRTTPNGQNVTSFSLAINRTWNSANGERQEETSFINCTAWGKTGETIAKYVSRGRQLLVSGRLQQRTWQDKDTGKNRSAIDVVVEEFSFVSDGNRSGEGGSSSAPRGSSSVKEPIVEDISDDPIDLSDIPF